MSPLPASGRVGGGVVPNRLPFRPTSDHNGANLPFAPTETPAAGFTSKETFAHAPAHVPVPARAGRTPRVRLRGGKHETGREGNREVRAARRPEEHPRDLPA